MPPDGHLNGHLNGHMTVVELELEHADAYRQFPLDRMAEREAPPSHSQARQDRPAASSSDAGSDISWSDLSRRLVKGGSFILDVPAIPPAIWGVDDRVLWMRGESLLLCGPTGVGKTTTAVQIIKGRLGLITEFLGLPIQQQSDKPVLWLAMDRPEQAARAMSRVFRPEDRKILDERLIIWKGPLPSDLGRRPETLAELCRREGAGTVVLDSLKDSAVKLSDDEMGGNLNRAMQTALVDGVDVLGLHHQRKGVAGTRPNSIDDVYGSTWITAGAGSVVLLWGKPGDPLVDFIHLKQPATEIGPWKLEHDHRVGTTSIYRGFDAVGFLTIRGATGATASEAAKAMFEKATPTDNERKKVQRILDVLVDKDKIERSGEFIRGGSGGSSGVKYFALGVRPADLFEESE